MRTWKPCTQLHRPRYRPDALKSVNQKPTSKASRTLSFQMTEHMGSFKTPYVFLALVSASRVTPAQVTNMPGASYGLL